MYQKLIDKKKEVADIQMEWVGGGIQIELEHLYSLIKKIPKKYRKQFIITTNNEVPIGMLYKKANNNIINFMKNDDNYNHFITHLWNFSDFIINYLNKFDEKNYDKLTKFSGKINKKDRGLQKKIEKDELMYRDYKFKTPKTTKNVEVIQNNNQCQIKIIENEKVISKKLFKHLNQNLILRYIKKNI